MSASGTGVLTRRRAVVASARAAATLLVCAGSGIASAPVVQALAGRDAAVLSGALRAERGLQDAYATAARAGGLGLATRAQVTRLGVNQKRAVEQFARSVGLAVPPPGVGAGSSSATGSVVLEALLSREERGIAEHAIALQRLDSGASAVALARLMAVKAQHTVVLRRLLGHAPLPRSFEPVAAR